MIVEAELLEELLVAESDCTLTISVEAWTAAAPAAGGAEPDSVTAGGGLDSVIENVVLNLVAEGAVVDSVIENVVLGSVTEGVARKSVVLANSFEHW